MTSQPMHLVMYLSPAGSTEKVGLAIRDRLIEQARPTITWNLSEPGLPKSVSDSRQPLCVWLGTPVYIDRALPIVCEALSYLPADRTRWGAGFAVYGAVTSGLALRDLQETFTRRGILPLGQMKVVAHHSQFPPDPGTPGAGRPSFDDLKTVHAYVDAVLIKLDTGSASPLDLSAHDYQTPKMRQFASNKSLDILRQAGGYPPTDQSKCVRCGMCVTVCPVKAIELNPFPIRLESCIFCEKCIQICPRQAYPFDHEAPRQMIRGLETMSDEEHVTRFFT
ncbi:MAG TPA: 4Fe-4S binding protein [Candidatus Ozemobacteraceae bacterium]|mgnify:CR=1 FL=1|nr:4Fe-4S binding protein [Candidatus Ozemobacteraceae bacterium]